MNEIEQARLHAADHLVMLFQAVTPQPLNPPSAKTCLDAVDAIANYTLQLHDEQVIKNAGRQPPKP